MVPLAAGTVLIAWPHPHLGHWLSRPLLPPGPLRFGGALALVGAGLAQYSAEVPALIPFARPRRSAPR